MKEAFSCQPRLVAYAHGMLRDHAAAEDVVQNAFLVVIDKHEQFEEGTSILAWTRAIVRLQVLRQLRDRKRELPVEDQILNDAVEAAFSTHQSGVDPARLDHLQACMTRLPDRARKTIELRYAENMGYQDIATTLGMTLEAVRKSLFRVKGKLRSCMELKAQMEAR
ncbi:MAG: RNA polymerase sigma-70 factor (ECF subfamily) [Rhodothermales bacterium]